MSEALHYVPFSTLALSLYFLPFFIAAKIMTRDYKFHLKETLFLLAAALIGSFSFNINRLLTRDTFLSLHIIEDVVVYFLLFVYFAKIKSHTTRKAITLATVTMLIIMSFEFSWDAITYFFFPDFLLGIVSPTLFLQTLPFLPIVYVVYIGFPLLFVKLTGKLRAAINDNETFQKNLAIISIFSFLFFQLAIASWRTSGYVVHFFSWPMILLSSLIIAMFVSFYFYMRSERERMALQQQKTEQKALQEYTSQIESYQRIVQQMQHDIGNVQSSMEGYLATDDLAGLKEYFYARIKPATDAITKDNFTLARLSNIKVPEIKATFAGKLMDAQSAGIDTTVEATDEIDHIPVDSVALVRMLGIILDNAIEELTTLGAGKLVVACYKAGDGVTFVVRNTCRPDIQKIHELKQVGFSTKGEGRGLGLNNLKEIADAHPDNISLQTTIENGNFTQKLRIGGAKS